MTLRAVIEGGDVIEELPDRIVGRYAAVDVEDPTSGKIIVKAGEMIQEGDAELIDEHGVDMVTVRSALTCESDGGICGKCYGRDLARGTEVNMGEAVGVIAAQSIGGPRLSLLCEHSI